MIDLFGNVLAAIDFETTGRLAGFHEPCQVAVVALDAGLRPMAGVPAFYKDIRPEHWDRCDPVAMGIHRIPAKSLQDAPGQADVAAELLQWMYTLKLPAGKRLIPLAHSWPFEYAFSTAWLGLPLYDQIFARDARDTRATAIALNDLARARGEAVPYPRFALGDLCNQLGVRNNGPHDALWDAVAEAEVYRRMLVGNDPTDFDDYAAKYEGKELGR